MLTELLREFALQERLHEDLEALKVNLLKSHVRKRARCLPQNVQGNTDVGENVGVFHFEKQSVITCKMLQNLRHSFMHSQRCCLGRG